MVLRLIFYEIYLIGLALFTVHGLSKLIFHDSKLWDKVKHFVKLIIFASIWPLSLFSSAGQKILFTKLEDL